MSRSIDEFRKRLAELDREQLIDLLRSQDVELVKQVNRIEWVFANKLSHLNWSDGTPVTERPLTNEELALLVDPPFSPNKDLADMGLTMEQQRQIHIASDPVLWSKHFLEATPRVYQILMLRHPSIRKVLRAGRRLGKTYTMALMILHYAYTHKNGRILVMAPMKPQVGLIFEEVMKLAKNSDAVFDSITRSVTSPQYEIHLSNGSTVRFFTTGLRSGGKCLTPDHDVLTKDDGWKPVADVSSGEIVASWDNGQLVWAEAAATWSYNYKGKMLEHEGRQLSFKVTPNHKFKVRSTNQGSPYRWIQATEMKGDLNIPAAGKALPTETDKYSGAELEMWGWWLSEGSGFDSNMARISQTKPHGRKRIIEVAQELGVHYTEYEREIRVAWRPPEFSGINAYDKFIPRFLLTEEHRDRLLQGLLEGDGWMRRKGWEYSSSSHALAEGVHELALMMGLRTHIREKKLTYKPVHGGPCNRHWVVSAYPYETYTTSRPETGRMRWVDYDGPVHCITVPQTGTFVTRRNGVAHITGNSDVARGQEAHLIILDELDYMGPDDLDALYAMLQKTDDNQPDKILVGASTPTGRRERFWEWSRSPRFKEFWFPSYANPHFDKAIEEEMRAQYNEMAYRHEIEADWGEDVEGVYPRRYVDAAFLIPGWKYIEGRVSARSEHLIGVDWDKYGAGPNIVVLEMCNEDYEDERFAGKLRLAFREEIPRNEYVLTQAVERIIELNAIFNPKHIYVDRGYGDVQVELLAKYGVEHPQSGIKKKLRGISFAQMIEMKDPATKQTIKKEMKPFMVDNLRTLLEKGEIVFPEEDEELYLQLISYVVVRTTTAGRPVFEASGSQVDHAHDALMLAALAYTQNYGDLMRVNLARRARSISNELLLPMFEPPKNVDVEEDKDSSTPTRRVRSGTASRRRSSRQRAFQRKTF